MVEHTSHYFVGTYCSPHVVARSEYCSEGGDEGDDRFAVRWTCTGFTHVVFFGPRSSWDEVKDGLKVAKKEMGPLEKRGTDDDYPSYGLYHIVSFSLLFGRLT